MRYFLFRKSMKRDGFTLIELMVTITVIGILVAIVYTNFSQARMQARDKMRMSQLDQLRVALELYKDKYGRYPAAGCNASVTQWAGAAVDSAAVWDVSCQNYIAGSTTAPFVPEFMEELPLDPLGTSTAQRGIFYKTNSTGSFFAVMYHLSAETLSVPDKSYPYARFSVPGCTTAHQPTSYAIYGGPITCPQS